MRFLKGYEIYENKSDIDSICKKYHIKDYTINTDGSIDVGNYVNLYKKGLSKLPIKFGRVNGDFACDGNRLITLEGSPTDVIGDFSCDNNKLSSLEGGPIRVSGGYFCYQNTLKTLKGSPEVVGQTFNCEDNSITSLKYGPKKVRTFDCGYNELTTLVGCSTIITENFWCDCNELTTLKGCPDIHGDLSCIGNTIVSLEFIPKIGGNFNYDDNPIYYIIGRNSNDRELFNDADIIRFDSDTDDIKINKPVIIYDRLKWFCEETGRELDEFSLKVIEEYYRVIK